MRPGSTTMNRSLGPGFRKTPASIRRPVLFAVAAEGDDEYIWSRLKMLPELFTAGPVAIRVGFFGAEGTRSSRPFMVSRWTTNPADLADLLQKARTRCVCGCFVKVSSILEQALRETQQGPLRAPKTAPAAS